MTPYWIFNKQRAAAHISCENGVLILSGIIESRLEMVKTAYAQVGMEIVHERRKGEWFSLVLSRKGAYHG